MKLLKSNRLLLALKSFFEKYYQPGSPLLLGYSGGVDSELLFQLLLELRKEVAFELHLAHVDHGWREESASEALYLQKKAEEASCPFHLKRLAKKNSEEEARTLRFAFFQTLFAPYGFQALLLAHQKNDVAETVFKRFLEGTHLPFLFGMEERGMMGNIPIWRPLLPFSKKEILEAVRESCFSPIDDQTNRDSTYLRARMRQELFPIVEKSFGKSILQNLYEASLRSSELKKYLDKKTQNSWEQIIQGPFGFLAPVAPFSSLEKVEKIHLLKRIAQERNIHLSRASLDYLLSKIGEKNHWRFFTKEALFVQDRDFFFIQTESFPPLEREFFLEEGVSHIGWWKISVSKVDGEGVDKNSWMDVWKNESALYLPPGKYRLFLPNLKAPCLLRSSLNKWWESHKTPAFMRRHIPVIYQEERVVGEFLSGKRLWPGPLKPFWKVAVAMVAHSGEIDL